MRKIFVLAFVLFSLGLRAQDRQKLGRIDSIAAAIDHAGFHVERDTLHKDQPDLNFFMTIYLTAVSDSHQLKKYVNDVHATMDGGSRQVVAINIFYFDRGKLIKVDESMTEGDKKLDVHWYYEDGKPLYYAPQMEKSAERAEQLIKIGQELLEKFHG